MEIKEMREELAEDVWGNDFDAREERHRILEYATNEEILREYYERKINIDNT